MAPNALIKSKVLSSNAAPLLLRFKPFHDSDPEPPGYIWKAGDDLSTDELILLFGEMFNRIWQVAHVEAEIRPRVTWTCAVPGTGPLTIISRCCRCFSSRSSFNF